MVSQPQLGDKVRDWYWQLIDRFNFIYNFYKDFTLQSHAEFILLGYKLMPLLGCKELAMTRFRHDAYFRCGDMIVKYWVQPAPEPKRELRKRIKELEEKLENELFSLEIFYVLFDIIIGLGTQPTIESVLGTYSIQRIMLDYESPKKVKIYLNWKHVSNRVYSFKYVKIIFNSPSAYDIDYNMTRTKEGDEYVITILTEIYNNRDKLINYISKANDFLMRFTKDLATYLLY